MPHLTLPTHLSLKHAVPAPRFIPDPLRMLCGSPDAACRRCDPDLSTAWLAPPPSLPAFFAVWQSHRLMDATPAEMIRTTNTNTTTATPRWGRQQRRFQRPRPASVPCPWPRIALGMMMESCRSGFLTDLCGEIGIRVAVSQALRVESLNHRWNFARISAGTDTLSIIGNADLRMAALLLV